MFVNIASAISSNTARIAAQTAATNAALRRGGNRPSSGGGGSFSIGTFVGSAVEPHERQPKPLPAADPPPEVEPMRWAPHEDDHEGTIAALVVFVFFGAVFTLLFVGGVFR